MNLEMVLKRPVVTEKSTLQRANFNEYAFEVDRRASKMQIRLAVEKVYDVDVVQVNTLVQHGKYRKVGARRSLSKKWKKAMVRLKEGQRIEFFEAK